MLRRFSVNYAVLSMALDWVLTLFALLIAVSLRPSLPQVPLLVPVNEVSLPLWVYILIPLLWVLVFIITSVYDPEGTYRLVDELQSTSLASFLAALICAGLFYLTFREFSRWLFITFVALNVVFPAWLADHCAVDLALACVFRQPNGAYSSLARATWADGWAS